MAHHNQNIFSYRIVDSVKGRRIDTSVSLNPTNYVIFWDGRPLDENKEDTVFEGNINSREG